MRVKLYIITWNEEKIIADIINHYRSRISNIEITIADNESTDSTTRIATSLGCAIEIFSTGGTLDGIAIDNIRNTIWYKDETYDWVGVVEADEFAYVDDSILSLATQRQCRAIQCRGFQMVGNMSHDTVKTVTQGVLFPWYSKCIFWHPMADVTLSPGGHGLIISHAIDIMYGPPLLHYKYINVSDLLIRQDAYRERLRFHDARDAAQDVNHHQRAKKEEILNKYTEFVNESTTVKERDYPIYVYHDVTKICGFMANSREASEVPIGFIHVGKD